MALILKQSTAVDVLIGPFLDDTDGATAETGESPAVKLSKNGQALAAKSDATTPVHDADGYYNCELDATDTNTVGTLVLTVAASAEALPVRHEFQVVEEAVYDDLFGGSAVGYPTAAEVWAEGTRTLTAIDEDSTTLDIDAALRAGLGMSSANLDTQLAAIPTLAELQAEIASGDDAVLSAIAGLNDISAADVWAHATRTLSALGFTLGASDLAADTIGASELAADAITEIVTGVWTTALTEAYNTDGAAPTGAQALFVIMQRLVDFAISGTTITVKKIDGTTTAYTLTLDDATSPTSSARAT